MLKRTAMLAVTAAVALVPITAAHASPAPAGLVKLDEPCILKAIKPPNTTSIFDPEPAGTHTDRDSDTSVEHDDWSYGGKFC